MRLVRSLVVALVVGCSLEAPEGARKVEIEDGPGSTRASAAPTIGDAGADADLVATAALHLFPRRGASGDDETPPVGPGIVLDGGYDAAPVKKWMHDASTGGALGKGDVVVLTMMPYDGSAGWLEAAPFASVQTAVIGDGATASDLVLAGRLVRTAEVVWFTGGDQKRYVVWKDTPIMAAVQAVFDRGGVIGGVSAGMIIMGSSVNDALVTVSEHISTDVAVSDPYDPWIHFTQRVLDLPPLARAITDPHFRGSDRMGRLTSFMARQVADKVALPDVLGIGVDDGAALVIDKLGRGRRLASGQGPSIFVVRGGAPDRAVAETTLLYRNLSVLKLANDAHVYDFARRCGVGLARTISVDGSMTPPYPADVYDDGGLANGCP